MENKASESVADHLRVSALLMIKAYMSTEKPGGLVDMKSTGTVSRVTSYSLHLCILNAIRNLII